MTALLVDVATYGALSAFGYFIVSRIVKKFGKKTEYGGFQPPIKDEETDKMKGKVK